MTPPHRTPEVIAKYAADEHARTQEDLNKLLSQFGQEYRQEIIDRLRPHLNFEPETLDKQGE